MIENPAPLSWSALQDGVCRLLTEIGLNAEAEVVVPTPRGSVEVDVYAIDERTVDKITYVVECKNWGRPVEQSVVHSFAFVMQETGANVGYLVTKAGLQSGAQQYLSNTNIIGLTYGELQARYFPIWWKLHFCPVVSGVADAVYQYVEMFNGHRDKHVAALDEPRRATFGVLQQRYFMFATVMGLLNVQAQFSRQPDMPPPDIDTYKRQLVANLGDEFAFSSLYWRDLMVEICQKLLAAEQQFNELFTRNIFE